MSKVKISICNELFEDWAIERVFSYASEIGYNGVEIAPFTLADSVVEISPQRRTQIRHEAEKYGLEIVGLHWLFVSPKGLYLNHPDERIRLATQEYLVELIKFCGDLGGRTMVVGSPKQRNVLEGHAYKEAWELTKEVFGECLPVAEEKGVTLCIEPLDEGQTNFINTAQEGLRLVRELDHPHFKLMVDVRAAVCQGEQVAEVIRSFGEYIVHIHANDANGRGPGFGDTDYDPIAQAIKDISYDRYVSVEVFDFKPDPKTIAQKSLDYLKRFL